MSNVLDYFRKLYKSKFTIIFLVLFSFFISYFISSSVDYYNAYYQCEFTCENVTFEKDKVVSEDNIRYIYSLQKDKVKKRIDIDKIISEKGIYFFEDNGTYVLKSNVRYYQDFFFEKKVQSSAEKFLQDFANFTYDSAVITFKNPTTVITKENGVDALSAGIITSSIVLGISLISLIFIKIKEKEEICDNVNIFKSPFHLKYWKDAISVFSSTKNIASLGMLFALQLASKALVLPSGFGELGLSFGFIILSIICAIYGPVAGIIIGALSDVIGFFLFPQDSFNFGYTIQAMLTGFTTSLFYYRTKLTYSKILICRSIVCVFYNALLGSFLLGMVKYSWNVDQVLLYMFTLSLPKNLIYLIPQSIVLYLIFKVVLPIFVRFNLIDSKIVKNISLI